MNGRDVVLASIVVWIWGINFIAVKLGVRELPPLLLTALRFALVAGLVVPFLRVRKGQLALIALLSTVLCVGHFGLLFVGLKGLDAGNAAIAIQLTVPFSALLAAALYKERLGRIAGFGMLLAFLGVGMLAGQPQRPDPLYLSVVVVAAMAWALSNVVVKRIGPVNPVALNGWMSLFAVPQLLVLSLIFEHGQAAAVKSAGWYGWGAVAFTAIASSLVAHSLWYSLIRRLPFNKAVPFTMINPVIGIAAAVLLLHEPFGWHKMAGSMLTLMGVALMQFFPGRQGEQALIEAGR